MKNNEIFEALNPYWPFVLLKRFSLHGIATGKAISLGKSS